MDLPTCPACGQSVLDDDAEECPFCGSSMSGAPVATAPKPTAKTKSPSASKTKKKKKKRPAAKLASQEEAVEEAAPDDDDPFAVSAPSKVKAIQLRRKPEKGRRHRVVCPMCETKGYTAKKAAGMEVRCPNPDCLIPVFTAPAIEEPKDEDEEADADVAVPWWKSPANIAAVGAMVAVVGVGLWFFVFREKPSTKSAPNPADTVPGTRIDVVKTGKTDGSKTGEKQPDAKVAEKKVPLLELRQNAINVMERTVGSGEISDTLRPASFQLIADTYAQINEKKSSHEYINRLTNVASNVPFYEVRPLVELAWQEMKRDPENGTKIAERYLDRAAIAAESLVRQTSRIRQDTVSILAAGYFAVGRKDSARKLIESHAHSGDTGRTSLALVTAWHSDDSDYHAALIHSPYIDSEASQHVAVARILIHRGRLDAALDWAQTQSGSVAKRECLLTWLEARGTSLIRNPLVRKPDDESDPQEAAWENVAAVISGLDTAGQVAAQARISLHAKTDKVATEWLDKARAAAGKLPKPQTIAQPSVKQVFELPAVSAERKHELRLAAIAMASLARAENRRDKKSGWKSLSQSLEFARSLAPSPVGIRERRNMASSSNLAELRGIIAREFNLDQANRVNQKVAEFRQRCVELQAEADAGFQFLVGMLEWAIDWSTPELSAEIWKDVSARIDAKKDAGFRAPFLETRRFAVRVPWMLAAKLSSAGDQKTAEAIRSVIRDSGAVATARQECLDKAAQQIAAGNFAGVAVPFNRLRSDSVWRRQRGMAIACQISKQHGVAAANQFVAGINRGIDPYLRFDSFNLIAALSTRAGNGRDVWKLIDKSSHPGADKIALCHGFIVAVPAKADESAAPPPGKKASGTASE